MSTARSYHSATLLPSGKVLVAGGYTGPLGSIGLASAELFDPATSTWTAAAAMHAPRAAHTATLLNNDKVLVVAGRSTGGDSTSAEIYDPIANSWSPAGNIKVARTSHKALLLRNGRVLVWGGFGPAGVHPPAELYDPGTNTWSVMPGTDEHFISEATLLSDGRVLAMGDMQNWRFQFAGIFDPISDVWTHAALPPSAVASSVRLGDGKVLFSATSGSGRAAAIYDPTSDSWTATSSMSMGMFGQSILLRDGRVLAAGSAMNAEPGCGAGCPNAEIFDPIANAWTLTKPMTVDRGEQTMNLLADGRVLVAGGFIPPNPDSTAMCEIFDPNT